MDTIYINYLIRILKSKNLDNVAKLLEGCKSAIVGSDQYGSYTFSILSEFVIYAPIDKYYTLKQLPNNLKKQLLGIILDISPPEANKPEITSIQFRLLNESLSTKNTEETKQYVGHTLRVFLSYSTEDKLLVGKIKLCLEKYGIEVFVAHEDIRPSSEWQDVILENLDSTDIFIPVITSNFQLSDWADQESGFALANNKLIIPISINGNMPYGFLNKYQALKFKDANQKNVLLSCKEIIHVLSQNSRFSKALLDSIIKILPDIWSFDEAGIKFEILDKLEYSQDQINELIKYSIQNPQIYSSRTARPYLLSLIKKYKQSIEKDLLGQLSVKIGRII